ncbi:MAG: hypothetical protein ACE5JB_01585 [bacterium]
MVALRFDFRDLFRSNRLAFSLQRIWIQFLGLSVGYFGYFIFTILSFLIAGKSISWIIDQYGLFPCLLATSEQVPLIAKFVFGIGCLFLTIAFLITNTAVSRASFMVLKGNNFYTWREAFAFSLKKSGAVLLSPIAIGLLIVAFLVGAWFIGLLGRIPNLGEIGISLFTLIWISASLFMVFLTLVGGVVFILAPAILATTNEDAFEAIFQSFSTSWSQPWRLILYEGIVGILSVTGFVILAIFVKRSFLLMNELLSFSMGDNYIKLAAHAQYILQSWTLSIKDWLTNIFGSLTPYFYFSRDFIARELPITVNIAAYIFSINMVIVGFLVLSYLLATFNTGSMITYLVLRRLKDDENLLERQDEEFEQKEEEMITEESARSKNDKESENKTEIKES